jgi:hypothetical protein
VSTVRQIGPRASLILGMLVGQPMTANELHMLIVRVNEDPELMGTVTDAGSEWDADLAIRTLAVNPFLVGETLERLQMLSMVDALDLDGATLWSARRTADWPS